MCFQAIRVYVEHHCRSYQIVVLVVAPIHCGRVSGGFTPIEDQSPCCLRVINYE